jgi:hypothetical protein
LSFVAKNQDTIDFFGEMLRFLVNPTLSANAAVAQLDRVLGYEPRGRGFDSCQPHQIEPLERKFFGVFFVL